MATSGLGYYNEYFTLLGPYFYTPVTIRILPQEVLHHPVPSFPHRFRVGRVIGGQADHLFSDFLSDAGTGGVVLARRLTEDDYIRLHVPDTGCPPLPEPDVPLDSGVVDEAEPHRWLVRDVGSADGAWLFSDDGRYVRTLYPCYSSGPFRLEVSFSNPDIGGGFFTGPQILYGVPEFDAYDLFYVRYGPVLVGAGYHAYAATAAADGLAPQDSRGAVGWGRHGWVLVWKSVSDDSVQGHVLAPVISNNPAGQAQLVLSRGGDSRIYGTLRVRSGSYWVDIPIPSLVGHLGVVPQSYPVEFGRTVHFVSGSLTDEQRRQYLYLNGGTTFRMSSARTTSPSAIQAVATSRIVDFGTPVSVLVEEMQGVYNVRWRSSDSLDSIESQSWSSDVPSGYRRYWQFRFDFSQRAPYRELAERVTLQVLSDGVGPGDGGTDPGGDGLPALNMDEIVPRNLGVYWSYGQMDVDFYGQQVSVPVSLYTALLAGMGWIGRIPADAVQDEWKFLASGQLAQVLSDRYICALRMDATGSYVYMPAESVDSVGARFASVGPWIAALLKPYMHRWLGMPASGSVRQDIVNTLHRVLRSIPLIRESESQVIVAQDMVLIRISLYLYGITERISFSISGSAGGVNVELAE